MIAPSGEQFEISLLGTSGRLSSRSEADSAPTPSEAVTILDGYGADEMCARGRGQVLIPWPNRIEDGALRVRRALASACR